MGSEENVIRFVIGIFVSLGLDISFKIVDTWTTDTLFLK
jgi:hypothetical protein